MYTVQVLSLHTSQWYSARRGTWRVGPKHFIHHHLWTSFAPVLRSSCLSEILQMLQYRWSSLGPCGETEQRKEVGVEEKKSLGAQEQIRRGKVQENEERRVSET